MTRMHALEAVTFDATGTLFHCPRLGEIYAEVLARHGVEVTAERAAEVVRRVWEEKEIAARLGTDRFASHPRGAKGFWSDVLDRVAAHLACDPPGPFAAAELFDRFARGESWEVYPEVPAVLAELAGRGLRLGVIANWDERLPRVLGRLGLADAFEAVVWSQDVGVEKPHPAIFASALDRLDLEPPAVAHVGDRRRIDAEGAVGAGMVGLHLDRSGTDEQADLADLSGLPAALPGQVLG